MIDIVLQISPDLHMRALKRQAGHEGTHNFVRFVINRPSILDGYICRADISVNGASNYLLVENNAFLLPNSLTKAGELSIQLVYIRSDGDIVAKTNIVTLSIGNSINAVDEADMDFQDGLAQLATNSFTAVDYSNSTLSFRNINGDIRGEVIITGGVVTDGNDVTSIVAWRPTVDEDGNLSWKQSASTETPETVNIMGAAGADGENGLSAYEVAVNNGFVGTETEWLASLVGANGQDGTDADMTRVESLESAVEQLSAESTSKWVLLNTIDTRSSNNATSIISLQDAITNINSQLDGVADAIISISGSEV